MRIAHFEFRRSQSASLSEMGTVYCSIRANSTQSKPFSTGIGVQREHFDSKRQEITNCTQTNELLRRIGSDIVRLHNLSPSSTAEQLHRAYRQKADHKNPLLLGLYAEFFDEYELQNANEESVRTYRLNERAMQKYLAHIGRNNLTASEVNQSFLGDFQLYLKTVCKNYPVTVVKRGRFLKRILGWACTKELIDKHPLQFVRFQIGKQKAQAILDMGELEQVNKFTTSNPTLLKVKAMFLFQCYTGLSFTDMETFGDDELKQIDGVECIVGNRNKTEVSYILPFLPKAKAIYEAYGKNMRLMTVQKYNLYLKDLGKQVGFTKVLTSHVARRTAGSYFLNNGVSMETTSRVLGHSSIRETERVYAKKYDTQIIAETRHLLSK